MSKLNSTLKETNIYFSVGCLWSNPLNFKFKCCIEEVIYDDHTWNVKAPFPTFFGLLYNRLNRLHMRHLSKGKY